MVFAALVILAFFPSLTLAQSGTGLVPCGTALNTTPCSFCDLITLANNVIDFLFKYIVLPLMAVGILAAGIRILISGASSGQLEKGKQMLYNLGIGFFIAATAWVALNMILGNIVKPGYNFLTQTFPACKTTSSGFQNL